MELVVLQDNKGDLLMRLINADELVKILHKSLEGDTEFTEK